MALPKRANDIWIAPSVLSADFGHLAQQLEMVSRAGADLIHLDVMDGHFVPNLTIGPAVVKSIRGVTDLPFDAHLMITDPLKYAPRFAEVGADNITFHAEVVSDSVSVAREIAGLGVSVGISINPETPVETIFDALEHIDLVLIMSVHPGFGGQAFMPEALEKIKILRRRMGPDQWLEIDGGINLQTIGQASSAGVNCFVAGAAIFGADDPARALQNMRATALQNKAD